MGQHIILRDLKRLWIFSRLRRDLNRVNMRFPAPQFNPCELICIEVRSAVCIVVVDLYDICGCVICSSFVIAVPGSAI